MSTVDMSVANTEYDAAQALLDLQSNNQEINHYKYDRKESIDTANLFLSCFIASNVSKQANNPTTSSPKIGTVSPMYAVPKNTTIQSDVANKYASTLGSPHQEIARVGPVLSYYNEESSKRSKIFKRKPSKHFTVTSGSVPDIVANKASNSAKKLNMISITETKVKTREVGTQTDDKYQFPIIETMEFTIAKLCEKIKSLEAQIKQNSQLMHNIDPDVTDHDNDFEDDDDDDYTVNPNKMIDDDSDVSESDMDETFTDRETPEKGKSKYKRDHGHNDVSKVLSSRNVNADADLVPLGDGNALIPSRIFRHINWNSYTSATRKLLTAVFSRRILATHSLTGKPSPAFPNKPAKKKLDPALVNDIVQTVVERCCVPENVVRTSITTKCADESKMFRTRQNNKKKRKYNRENIPPESDSDEF